MAKLLLYLDRSFGPMRRPFASLILVCALLSGCVVEEVPDRPGVVPANPTSTASPPPSQADAGAAQAQPSPAPHGEPQVTQGPVESGLDPQRVPGAYARQTTTITNGFGAATLADWTADIAAGLIQVQGAERDGYLLEATREVSAATEADARAMLERTHLNHTDQLQEGVVRLTTRVDVDAVPDLVPGIVAGPSVNAMNLRVTLQITVPTQVALQLDADTASGDIALQSLQGPKLRASSASGDLTLHAIAMAELLLDTASGDIDATDIQAEELQVDASSGDITLAQAYASAAVLDTASGDIRLQGSVDDLLASSSSGDIELDAAAQRSGVYELDSASGSLTLELRGAQRAYRLEADTASGDITVEIPDANIIEQEERHVELESKGFDKATLQTRLVLGTSSGNIDVEAE